MRALAVPLTSAPRLPGSTTLPKPFRPLRSCIWALACAIAAIAQHAAARQNLLQNPSFENGATGYSTQYSTGPVSAPGRSTVGTNPSAWNPGWPTCTDHTSPGDKMLLVDGIYLSKFWSQTVNVQPNTAYSFRFWSLTLDLAHRHPPYVGVGFRDIATGLTNAAATQLTSAADCVWREFETGWESQSTTQVEVYMYDLESAPDGNDLAVDDVVFEPCTKVPVILSSPPSVVRRSTGQSLTLTVSATAPGGAPLTYQWRRNANALTDGPRTTGSQTSSLTITPVMRQDRGVYDCQVSSTCATRTSGPSTLVVVVRLGSADPHAPPGDQPFRVLNAFARFLARETHEGSGGSGRDDPVAGTLEGVAAPDVQEDAQALFIGAH